MENSIDPPPELDRKLDRPLPNSIANSIAPSHLTANSTALPYSTADAITDNADGWLRAKRGQHEYMWQKAVIGP